MSVGKPTVGQLEDLLIPEVYVTRWLEKHRQAWGHLNNGSAYLLTTAGKVPVTMLDVQRMIAAEDAPIWAWMNLVEKNALTIDGVEAVVRGQPWALFPIQAKLARCDGDLIVECGAEVGKTRDVVLQLLYGCDTRPGSTWLVGGDSDQTLIPIYEEIEYQLDKNPLLAGGLEAEKCHIKPNRKLVFKNGSEIELRLATTTGKNFRGGHFTGGIFADEAAMWKNPRQWSEFFRSALPGCVVRIYSTPDGDYSSPFYEMCARATPVGGTSPSTSSPEPTAPGKPGERRFRKFHIAKNQLPAPFWSEARDAELTKNFGGKHTAGYITNVLGEWGSPSYSVFPMPTLEPCLQPVERYALVTLRIDKRERMAVLSAARLAPAQALEEDSPTDEVSLANETFPMPESFREGGAEIGRRISAFFPSLEGLVTPKIRVGGDLGSAVDPTELLFVLVVGKVWTDLFRLHLRGAEWNEQQAVFTWLDHASGHQARYSLDNGSAGSVVVSNLTQEPIACPACTETIYFAERLVGRGFGQACEAIDIETGAPIGNPDDKDSEGRPRPLRLLNKEFSTRVLEQKMAVRELVIARDAGAGDQRLAGPQLLVNHTASGTNKKGERTFRAVDDHHVDARRQVALEIVDELRDPSTKLEAGDLVTSGVGRMNYDLGVIGRSVRSDFGTERIGDLFD